ncbi:glycosyltransferase family 2 protein [bacterium 1XD42-94]|jgi:glycosyltransferase involved in cell wall biosynthesis|nr:glycosyltransferase family 2 protein [bacterium 1XD42-76]NBK05478.1 glycosyltransferase family 2 protein [bacterium 1XD42-94]
MEGNNKLLTIIVPAYNVEKYVGQCLNSLVKQTVDNHKVIVVDDGSKDEHTSRICREFAEQYPEMITYLRQENKGLGAARNTGLALVDTEYVGFLDSDDWLTPNYVERVTEELENFDSEQIDLIFTLPTIYDAVTQNTFDWYDKELLNQIFFTENRIVSAVEDKQIYYLEPNACRRIYRTDFLRTHQFRFPEGVKWEDIFPHFYLAYHASACIGVNDVGFYYRTNTSGQITAQSGKGRLDIVKVFRDVFRFAKEENCDWEIVEAMINMLNRYAKWCLDMSDLQTRPELVKKLSDLYRSLPPEMLKRYFKTRRNYKKERLFVWMMQKNRLRLLLCDYLPSELSMNVVNRIRRAL